LEIFLASSEEMPSFSAMSILDCWPDWRGSEASRTLSETLRLMSFSLKTSSTALVRSSAEALISMACSPFHSIVAPVPLKSKRVATSRGLAQRVVHLLAVELADDVEGGVGHGGLQGVEGGSGSGRAD